MGHNFKGKLGKKKLRNPPKFQRE